jgi:hypothetical protein
MNNKNKLYFSFELGHGFSKEIKRKNADLYEGIRELDRELSTKYGIEMKRVLNNTKVKKR